MLKTFYDRLILPYPRTTILLIVVGIVLLGYQARNLELDASAETLVLEDDEDLRFTRLINDRYGNSDFLIISYTPHGDLFSDAVLGRIALLRDELSSLEGVDSVTTLLDVPLLESSNMSVKELVRNVQTLESATVNKELAKEEFRDSPLYRNLIVSPDLKTTALQVNLPEDERYRQLLNRRNELRSRVKASEATAAQRSELEEVSHAFKEHRDRAREQQHRNILQVRAVMDRYRNDADLFLGGVSMIADDMVTFIKNDLKVFGLGVVLFLGITLGVIFRQLRWVVLPLLCSAFSVIATCGILGLFGWEVTVISSNFISLQLIITMSLTIHLVVRYRELCLKEPQANHRQLVLATVTSMATPCFYAVLTTVAGFSSLLLCDILPVINFGWMMSAGIALSLVLTFLVFPSLLLLMPMTQPNTAFETHFGFTRVLARFTQSHGRLILGASALLLLASALGASRLVVENSFINYFKESTEIHQGMKVIDQQLGGTTPLDVLVDLEQETEPPPTEPPAPESTDLFDEFEAEFEAQGQQDQYWFTSEKMAQVEQVHDYLNTIPETGKVLSLATMLKVGRALNDGEPLDNFALALIYNKLPQQYRRIVMTPYVSVEHNQVRFALRVRDSEKELRRNELLQRIRADLTQQLGLKENNVHLAGLLLLYNNMLQSLFRSQILTLGAVVAALLLMFLVLFRSLKIAVIAIGPNLLAVGTVLGFMGWLRIPLDMMTITIAAISVGIAVDDTIHYIHRFRREFARDGNYLQAMHRCHGSIGYAMYYTSVTIIIGFSVLVFSNFIPSIYFGLLTVLAMAIALLAALTLLPQLLILVRPFEPKTHPSGEG
jgi:predicted RND superfamily exporter protein